MKPIHNVRLRSLPLFRGLEEACLRRLERDARLVRLPKNGLLFSEGEKAEWLHVLVSGGAEAFTTIGNKDCTILILEPSDVCMPAAALVEQNHLLSARALRSTRVLLLPATSVRSEMILCNDLACRLSLLLAGQLRVAIRTIKDLKTRSAPQRLAAFLLRLVDEKGIGRGAELTVSKAVLASRLGMSAETLSRSLQVVGDHGIGIRGHRVTLKDRDRVELYCRPDAGDVGSDASPFVKSW